MLPFHLKTVEAEAKPRHQRTETAGCVVSGNVLAPQCYSVLRAMTRKSHVVTSSRSRHDTLGMAVEPRDNAQQVYCSSENTDPLDMFNNITVLCNTIKYNNIYVVFFTDESEIRN